ncbi:hypothetical protein Vadar_019575 [Vaccinium darrowii]|uniref:Uncharacterized protein n=1 Tax=Vaccinium darrowii TaxID=229202 RepID=A0ACB7YEY0_9ERIC|nr:hypothetical protein Vadar_019575 [Vaccinium darrowii]
MANRFVPPKKLLQTTLHCSSSVRPLNATAPPSLTALSPLTLKDKPTTTTTFSNSIINLDDTKSLFSSLSTTELLCSAINLQVAAVKPVVDLGMWVMNSKLMNAVNTCPGKQRKVHDVAGNAKNVAEMTPNKKILSFPTSIQIRTEKSYTTPICIRTKDKQLAHSSK